MRMKSIMLLKGSYSFQRVLYDALLLRHNFDVYERRYNFAGSSPYHPIYRCNVQKIAMLRGMGREGGWTGRPSSRT